MDLPHFNEHNSFFTYNRTSQFIMAILIKMYKSVMDRLTENIISGK